MTRGEAERIAEETLQALLRDEADLLSQAFGGPAPVQALEKARAEMIAILLQTGGDEAAIRAYLHSQLQ